MTYQDFADKYLSGEVKNKYLKNIQESNVEGYWMRDKGEMGKYHFISTAFPWADTPEGYCYWETVKNNIEQDQSFYTK